MPPGWSSWHTVLNADTNHYFYGYTAQQQRHDRRPLRRLGQLGNARIRRPRRHRLPVRADQRPALLLRDRHLTELATREIAETPAEQPFYLQLDYTAPARRLPPPGRPRAGAAPLRLVQGRPPAPRPLAKASTRATSATSRASSAKRRPPHASTTSTPTASTGRSSSSRCARSTTACKLIVDTLGGVQPAAQHLHPLHLRQRLLLRRAPADRRQVPRLRAGHPPALPDPRPGHRAGHPDRRARRATSTSRRPILELAGVERRQEHRRPLDGPLPARPEPAHPAAAALRVLRRDQRRRAGRRRRNAARLRTGARPGGAPGAPERRRRRAPPRSSPRRRTTRESASAPTSTSPGRPGRRSSTTSTRTRTSSTTWSRSPTSSRSATTSTRCSPAASKKRRPRGLRRPRPAAKRPRKSRSTGSNCAASASRKRKKNARNAGKKGTAGTGTQRKRTAKGKGGR